MSKISNSELKSYYSEISNSLICSKKEKTAFMSQLKADISDYLAVTPDADIEKLQCEFGTPRQIGNSFTANSDAKAIKKKLDIKKCILVAILIALVIYLAFVVLSLIDVHTEAHGYMEEGIMMIKTATGGDIL